MKYIVSDLHLGGGLTRSDDVSAFLDTLQVGDELTLNGDTWDGTARVLFSDAEMAILNKLDSLRSNGILKKIVRGNHDPHPEKWASLLDVSPGDIVDSFVIEDSGKKFLVLHGHQFDPLCVTPNTVQTWAITMERWIAYANVSLARWIKAHNQADRNLAGLVRVGALSQARGYDGVTCGHTHLPDEVTVLGTRYVNSGSWVENLTPNYVTIDNGVMTLRTWKP